MSEARLRSETSGSRVLVTGCSSGIGRATALLLHERGHHVFAGIRRIEDGVALRNETSERVVPVRLDVTSEASISEAHQQVCDALGDGRLDGLVNNAGMTSTMPMEFVDLDQMREQFDINVFGVAAMTKAFLPLLARPGGRVVNVSSGSGKIVTPLMGSYSASKFALEAMSDALRIELRREGLHVAVIEPGFIETSIHEKNERQLKGMLGDLPPEGRARYEPAIEKLRQTNDRFAKTAAPARDVALAIAHALSARRPKTRYPVTREAHLLAWLGPFLGDRMRDAIFGRIVGL
jgi:NAD(P)-dependent dehydrogenase (short-subunit alcohol dehydrogenase family)